MCHKDQQIYLKLRGLCPDSNIDKFWVPRNKKGLLEYYGIISSEIHFNYEDYIWKMKVWGKKEKTIATSGNSFGSLLLGKSTWDIERDSTGCNRGQPYTADLKMSGCGDEEFTCYDGQCIDIENRCDTLYHCRDKSDEEDCKLLILEKGFKKNVPPFTMVSSEYTGLF